MKKRADLLVFPLLFLLCLKLAFDLNFPQDQPEGDRVIWSDKAAYYVYLPALFQYHFDAAKFPDERIGKRLGYGFDVSHTERKIKTRMTYGVALLASPFYLAALWITEDDGSDAGFSRPYRQAMVISGVFYLVAGLFFLRRFLLRYLSVAASWITTLVVLFATHLFFYGLRENLMSHVYSFFLISLFLYTHPGEKPLKGKGLWLGILSGLLILIRPTHLILLLFLLFLDVKDRASFHNRIAGILSPRFWIPFTGAILVIYLPQLIYWKYWTGHFLHYSYGEQGFSNLWGPPLMAAWFSPLNGLFLYTPFYFLILSGMVMMILHKNRNGWLIFFCFFGLSYLYASWDQWYYGGSFGWRPMVDDAALFALPAGYLINQVLKKGSRGWGILVFSLILLMVLMNLRMTFRHWWYNGSVWDWDAWRKNMVHAGLMNPVRRSFRWIDDGENQNMSRELQVFRGEAFSGRHSLGIPPSKDTVMICNYQMNQVPLKRPVRLIRISFMVNPEQLPQQEMQLLTSLFSPEGHLIYSQQRTIVSELWKAGTWQLVQRFIFLPARIPMAENRLVIRMVSPGKGTLLVDDLTMKFE